MEVVLNKNLKTLMHLIWRWMWSIWRYYAS